MAVSLTVDGQAVTVAEGASVLEAVRAAGAVLPSLCKDKDQGIIGACRTCIVDITGMRPYPASCHTPAREGMEVRTDSPGVAQVRRTVLELTWGMGAPDHSPIATPGPSELLTAVREQGAGPRFPARGARPADRSNPFFTLNHDDCILCGRCVVACQDVQHIGAIAVLGRGTGAHIGTFMDRPVLESICTSCGQCVSVCPTGAILPNDVRSGIRPPAATTGEGAGIDVPLVAGSANGGGQTALPLLANVTRTVDTTCPYCGVGCGVGLRIDGEDIIRFVDDQPANRSSDGMLCVKGRFGTTYVHHPDRLTAPLIRRNGELVPCSWDEALDYTAERLVALRGGFASLASAKGTNEDGYVQQKFVRMLMGTNNIDHCTRLCHSPSVEAMLQQLGSGATSNSYEDYEQAGALMVIGCDPSSNHPVIAARIRRGVEEHGAKLIVVNPRRIDLCNYTDLWLRPFPGTDVALFNALAKVILEEGLEDRPFIAARTENYDTWRAAMDTVDVAGCARITGVDEALIRRAARLYAAPGGSAAARKGSCLIWGMGVTQHTNGTDNAHAILNLALVTGQLGFPGSGVSPLRGQNNVQGCGDAGCIPDSLPGYQRLGAEARAKFEAAWGGASLPAGEGMRATDMIERAVTGEIRAMYIVGENPLLSEPNIAHAREGIERLDFLVVQDIFLHETAQLADVVLPAAAFAEKDGTFTNSERRVQRVRAAIPAPGAARPDWAIVCDLARRVAIRLDRDPEAFNYRHPSAIFAELGRVWPNVAGISYERLDAEGGLQWPCPTPDHPGTARMYGESFPRGLGRFAPVTQGEPAAELPSKRFPLILNTGRMLYHWHGGTITRRVPGLVKRAPVVPVAVHPQDAAALELADGAEVVISSRRGEMTATVNVTDVVRKGEVFVPFVRLAEHAANWLTNNVYDQTSRIPEYKVCAVRLDTPAAAAEWRRGRGRMTASGGGGREAQH